MLFPGDHVMGWSTTVVSPPDGDMAAYVESLRKVAGRRDDRTYWPTHGPAIDEPQRYVAALVEHRLRAGAPGARRRARRGRARSPPSSPCSTPTSRPELHKPAARSVLAHLDKLIADGAVRADPDGYTAA